MKNIQKINLVLLVLFGVVAGNAGTSVFNLGQTFLGEVQYGLSAAELGRGGFGAAYGDSVSLNHVNQAMWAYIPQTKLSVNGAYHSLTSDIGDQSLTSSSFNFSGGYMALPLLRDKLVIWFGLNPKLMNDRTLVSGNIGTVTDAYVQMKTVGNLTRTTFSLAYAYDENYAAAVNMYYYFGQIRDELWVNYSNPGYGDIRYMNAYQLHGPGLGISLYGKVTEKLRAGLRYDMATQLSMVTKQESSQAEKTNENYRKLDLPSEIIFGLAYYANTRTVIGLDVNYQNWEQGYKIDGSIQPYVTNSYRAGIGIEYLPTERKLVSYYEKTTYRAGFYLSKNYSLANNNDVNEYGITAGLGLPIRAGHNRLDIYASYGQRGNTSDNLAQENVFNFGVSVSAGELWFIREIR